MNVNTFKKFLIREINSGDPKKRIPIYREELVKMIKNTKGAFFTVTFVKKDGSIRTMNARLNVKKYLRGGSLPYDPIKKGLIPTFDVQKGEYRMINEKTIISAIIDGNNYIVK